MDKKRGNILKILVSSLVAVALLYFSFKGVKWSDFLEALKSCDWGFVILSMFAGLISFYLRALRWRELLLPFDPSLRKIPVFNAINISYVVNLALPRVGEIARCGYVTAASAKSEPDENGETHRLASFDKVLGTVALERSWDVVTMLLLLTTFLYFGWKRFGAFFMDNAIRPIMEKVGLDTLWPVFGAVAVIALSFWLIRKLSHKSREMGKVAAFFKGIWQGISSCLKMKSAWKFFALTAGIWFAYWLMSYSILLAIQGISPSAVSPGLAASLGKLMSLDWADALFLMLVGSIASVVPVPGGFGAFHYIVALAISSVYGVPFEVGIIFATLSHESQTLIQIICGGVSFASFSLAKKTTKEGD